MAAILKEKINIESTLIEGGGGVFDVVVDGNLVFSKKVAGRFPTGDEILEAIGA